MENTEKNAIDTSEAIAKYTVEGAKIKIAGTLTAVRENRAADPGWLPNLVNRLLSVLKITLFCPD